MKRAAKRIATIAIGVLVGAGCLGINENILIGSSESWMSTSTALIGRPATPMSYAGVARRTTAAVVAAPVIVAPVVVTPAPVVVTPRCVQSVDAYGRIYTRCY